MGIVIFIAACVGIGLLAARQFHRPAPPLIVPPEIPTNVRDAEIIAVLEKARKSVLSSPQSGQAWGELGMVFHAHRYYDQSKICYLEAARLDPTNPRWPYSIGLQNLQDGTGNAIPFLQTAYSLATDPDYKSAARLRLADAYLDSGELISAEKLLEEEVSVNSQSLRARHGQAVIAIRCGDYRAAIQYLKDTPNAAVHRQTSATLAACYRQLGEIATAERFERETASTLDEPWPDPYIAEFTRRQAGFVCRLRMATDLQKQGRWREAASIIEELVRTNPDDQSLVLLGLNLLQLRQFTQAEKVLRAALTKNKNHPLAHDYLGLSLSMQAEDKAQSGDRVKANALLELALIEFRLAVKLNPLEVMARLHSGLALKNLGKLSEAADEYRAGLVVFPEYAGLYLELGDVLLELNKPEEAILNLDEALRLAPNDRTKKLLEKAKSKLP